MNEVAEFLKANPVHYFATVGLDGKPKVRPFQFMFEESGKFYYCTNNQKKVYQEMQKQPYIEISVTDPQSTWIRLNGRVVFSSDMNFKKRIIQSHSLIQKLYQTAENPTFEIFYLDDAKAVLADFSGNPPREYDLSEAS